MKNGIYIETFTNIKKCEVYYIDGDIRSVKYPYGDIWNYKFGLLHNENGPAIKYKVLGEEPAGLYCIGGKKHRLDGPAEYSDEVNVWWVNDKKHREDGPAVEWTDGRKEWWINGKRIDVNNQKDFERYIKLLVFK